MSSKNIYRYSLRLSSNTHERVKYWYEKQGYDSINDFIIEAIEEKIAKANSDYDLPTAEIARLNQLVDAHILLAQNIANLEKTVINARDSLFRLVNGDYIEEDEDGEL